MKSGEVARQFGISTQTIHYYEAWLATLAILVWHFFFVILHPEEYPMSWTWLTGRMTREAAKENHGEWYEEEFGDPGEGDASNPEADHIGAGIED